MPDSLSVHLNAASRTLSCGTCEPSTGFVIVTDGLPESALNATRLTVDSTRPDTSVAWNWTKWLPVEKPVSGPEYVCHDGSPSTLYEMWSIPEPFPPPSAPASVPVGAARPPFWAAGEIDAVEVGFARSTFSVIDFVASVLPAAS